MIRGLALAAPPLDPWRGERLGAQSCGWGVNGGPVEGPGGPCPQAGQRGAPRGCVLNLGVGSHGGGAGPSSQGDRAPGYRKTHFLLSWTRG